MSTRGTIRRRGKASWEIRADAGQDAITGQRIRRYRTVRGLKRDAEKALTSMLAGIDGGIDIEPAHLTVAKYLERWLDAAAKPTVAPKTFERYAEIVHKQLVPALGNIMLTKLKPLHIQTAYSRALESGRRNGKGGLSAQTVKHHHRVLSMALKQAVRWQILIRNPAEAVDPPSPVRREMMVLDQAELARLIRAAEGTRLYVPVMVAATTGLRRGELLALRWRDVDLDRGALAVTQSLEQTRAGLRFKEPKTKRSRRTITLPSLTVEALRAHKVDQIEERLMMGKGYTDNGLVFANHDGSPISPRSFSKKFLLLVDKAGVPRITLHGLRHTHITHLLQANVHPKVASERAGHASVAITLDIYSHAVQGMQEDAAVKVDESLRRALQKTGA